MTKLMTTRYYVRAPALLLPVYAGMVWTSSSKFDLGRNVPGPTIQPDVHVSIAQVRKKAIMALHRFEQLDPEHDGPLAGAELEVHFRRMLCDKVRHALRLASMVLHGVCSTYGVRTVYGPYSDMRHKRPCFCPC